MSTVTRAWALALFLALGGCTRNDLLEVAMIGAPRPADHRALRVGAFHVLGGDLHCHVLPPDAPWHVTRDLDATVSYASKEKLDFVVLTPHVPARFFGDEEMRGWVVETQRELATRARAASVAGGPLVAPGMEYTDARFGHVGLSFADLDLVLAELPLEDARRDPARFFERWVLHGGLVTVNHPVLRPLPGAPFAPLRVDMSFRAFTRPTSVAPPEMRWIAEHAAAVETFNFSIGYLRDHFVLSEEDRSLREATHITERLAKHQRRRIAPVGGSDSHGGWLRSTTWVLSEARTLPAIRAAIGAGRTCVRGPEGCTFEARRPGAAAWHQVGGAFTSESGMIEVRAQGDATVVVDGTITAAVPEGAVARVGVSGRCSLVHAIVGESWSAPIYVDCPFTGAL